MQAIRFGNLASLALLCGAEIIAVVMALRLGVWRDGSPGPGLFPLMASIGIASLSAIGMLAVLLRSREATAATDEAASKVHVQGIWRVAIYMGALVGYALLLEPLGFFAVTTLTLFVILKLAERLQWRLVVPLILGALVSVHLLFERALGVYFPKGTVWDLFL